MMTRRLQPENITPVQMIDWLPVTIVSRLFAGFFAPFLSHKGLVFRRLWKIYGLIELRAKEKNVSQDKSTMEAGRNTDEKIKNSEDQFNRRLGLRVGL
jgi:hypothetical protein